MEVACSVSGSSAGTAIPLLAYLGEPVKPQASQLMTGTTCNLSMLLQPANASVELLIGQRVQQTEVDVLLDAVYHHPLPHC